MQQNFRTPLTFNYTADKITHIEKLFFIGSCFSENIGNYLTNRAFNVMINPFGTVYNPHSISRLLQECVTDTHENTILEHQGIYVSLHHHSSIHSAQKSSLEILLAEKRNTTTTFLQQANHVFITPGTAYVYVHKESGEIVSNCHKIPQQQFVKRLLNTSECKDALQVCIDSLRQLNPHCKLHFTLSPVRHIKDGMVENQRSKAILLESIWQCVEQNEQCFYFPSYEIMMDDLRDYRFYADDLIHPSSMAVEYIFSIFSNAYFSEQTQEINKEILSLQQAVNHKAFQAQSSAYLQFVEKNIERALRLKKDFPFLKIDTIIHQLQQKKQ